MHNARLSVALLASALCFAGACDNQTSPDDGRNATSSTVDAAAGASRSDVANSLIRVIRVNYKAMEDKESETVLSLYHPNTNLQSSKEELDQYFSSMDVSYDIGDIRYIGDDGTNFVVIYREVTEFRIRDDASKKVVDRVNTEVLMVFRKHDGSFKIFTSRSLKPGM